MKQIPLYEQIYEEIREKIEERGYRVGDRLPSEKELSEQYHVSRITSKKAVELLAEEGLVTRIPGKGTFVIERRSSVSCWTASEQILDVRCWEASKWNAEIRDLR